MSAVYRSAKAEFSRAVSDCVGSGSDTYVVVPVPPAQGLSVAVLPKSLGFVARFATQELESVPTPGVAWPDDVTAFGHFVQSLGLETYRP